MRPNYDDTLVDILCNSADVIPHEVAAFLRSIPQDCSSPRLNNVLRNYEPLAKYLGSELADTFLKLLAPPLNPAKYGRGLGVRLQRHAMCFYPPSCLNEPFLALLLQNEREGIRLVKGLVNSHMTVWTQIQPAKPVPVEINLPFGLRKFFGDVNVYSWFRHYSDAAAPVTSSLMALEVWLERQVASGRDPIELFNDVLEGTNSVSMLGVCASIALAHHDKSMRAALPLMMSSSCWLMDFERAVKDTMLSASIKPPKGNPELLQLAIEFDKPFPRGRSLRDLAAFYVWSDDPAIREPFRARAARFSDDVPAGYLEESGDSEVAQNIRERLELFEAMAHPGNYKNLSSPEELGEPKVELTLPEKIEQRLMEQQLASRKSTAVLNILSLVGMTQDTDRTITASEKEWLIRVANSFATQNAHEIYTDKNSQEFEALAGLAALLVCFFYDECLSNHLLDWCKEILMVASTHTPEDDIRDAVVTFDARVSAARGLGAMICHGESDANVHSQILKLLASHQPMIATTAARAISKTSECDPVFFWNSFVHAVNSCLHNTEIDESSPESNSPQWAKNMNTEHAVALCLRSHHPNAENVFDVDRLSRLINDLPVPDLKGSPLKKKQVLQFTEELLGWTIEQNKPISGYPMDLTEDKLYPWNLCFFGWIARLARQLSFEEIKELLILPVSQAWRSSPHLMVEVLEAYIWYHLSSKDRLSNDTYQTWEALCREVFHRLTNARENTDNQVLRDLWRSARLVVFVNQDGPLLRETWTHVFEFKSLVEEWLDLVGHQAIPFNALLHFLDASGWQYGPKTILSWLNKCMSGMEQTRILMQYSSNGDQSARLLLRLWHNCNAEIVSSHAELTSYSHAVDQLVAVGVPLSRVLQEDLEKLRKGGN